MGFDVTSLTHRRATSRWNRVAVGDLLERITWSMPDKTAIVGWEGAFAYPKYERLTYRQADRLANQVANAVIARKVSRNGRVLLLCENSVEAYLTKLGVAKSGRVVAPLNPSLAPDVVAYLFDLVQPELTIVDAEVWAKVRPAFEQLGRKPDVTIPIGGGVIEGSIGFEQFVEGASTVEPEVEIHGDDISELQFTSGTTAMPKGAMLSHVNTYMSATSYAMTLSRGVRIENEVKTCSFLPMIYHIGGQLFGLSMLLSSGTLILGRKPDGAQVAMAVTREKPSALWAGSPTMLNAFKDALLADRANTDARSLKVAIYGWASITPATMGALKDLCGADLLLLEIFGQTESIACHRFWPDMWPETFATKCPENNYVGIPSPLLASRIIDPGGQSLEGKPGVPGEAVYRSPSTMAGYYRNEEATALAFDGGWFHSGDSCAYDEQGLRVMIDRSKDIVKTGGENVSSLRVESVLVQHPAVARAAVVGLADERWGEAVTAVVIKKPNVEVTEADLIAFCRAKLAGFETPKKVLFATRYPETVGGKVMKHVLRAQLKDAQTAG